MGILGCCLVMLWPVRADQVVVAFCVLIPQIAESYRGSNF